MTEDLKEAVDASYCSWMMLDGELGRWPSNLRRVSVWGYNLRIRYDVGSNQQPMNHFMGFRGQSMGYNQPSGMAWFLAHKTALRYSKKQGFAQKKKAYPHGVLEIHYKQVETNKHGKMLTNN
jgi:hypothetical protein